MYFMNYTHGRIFRILIKYKYISYIYCVHYILITYEDVFVHVPNEWQITGTKLKYQPLFYINLSKMTDNFTILSFNCVCVLHHTVLYIIQDPEIIRLGECVVI